jgi:hypothetical protein
MKKTLVGFVAIIFMFNAHAKFYQVETVRLKSTAGAGVASILMDESSVLNPAPLAFFSESAIYLQKGSGKIIQSTAGEIQEELDQFGGAISDSHSGVKGSAGYFKQKIHRDEQSTFSGSLAGNVGKASALGFSFKDKTVNNYNDATQSYDKSNNKILTVGVLNAISSEFTIGLVASKSLAKGDEARKDNKAIAGFQYNMMEMFSVMLDLGSNYNGDMASAMLYKAATQMKIFSEFYLRFGLFSDKGARERGNGVGFAWVQPKLVLELGFSSVKDLAQIADKKTQETMFSLSYRF